MTPAQRSVRTKAPRNDSKTGVISAEYRDRYDDIFKPKETPAPPSTPPTSTTSTK